MYIFAALLILNGFNSTFADESRCIRTLIVGDSQIAFGISPFRFDRTFDQQQFDQISMDGFGTVLFKHFSKNHCEDSVFLYSQGGSGSIDWLGEGVVDQKPYPYVRYLGGSRMILQPGFSLMISRTNDLDSQTKKDLKIPPLSVLVSSEYWIKPDRVIVALSANDWWLSESEFIKKYKLMMLQARGLNHERECVLVSVAGVIGAHSTALRNKGEPENVTDENVRKLVRAGRLVANELGCIFSDVSSIEPSAGDGLHLYGKSAYDAAIKVISDMGL